MSGAQHHLDEALASVRWGETDHVVIANVDGAWHSSAEDWCELLSRPLTSPKQLLVPAWRCFIPGAAIFS